MPCQLAIQYVLRRGDRSFFPHSLVQTYFSAEGRACSTSKWSNSLRVIIIKGCRRWSFSQFFCCHGVMGCAGVARNSFMGSRTPWSPECPTSTSREIMGIWMTDKDGFLTNETELSELTLPQNFSPTCSHGRVH